MTELIPILFLIFVIVACVFLFKARKLHNNVMNCFVGTLGSGKTYMAVNRALKAYRKQRRHYRWYKRLGIFGGIYAYFVKGAKYPPTLYSNIPIIIGRKKGKPIYSEVLKKEHILKLEILPERCVVVIDELGAIASQWEYNNPYVMENITFFIRMFRQFTDGCMFVTDQDDSEFVKTIRCRLGVIYYLYDFHRWLGITPFFQVNCVPLLCVGEDRQQETTTIQEAPTDYFAGFLPYKWMKRFSRYDTRCYSVLYTGKATRDKEAWDSPKCNYLIDVSASYETSKKYKTSKEEFKDYLFEKRKDEIENAHSK